MKRIIILPILCIACFSFAQKPLPVIKASSNKAYIVQSGGDRHNWNLSPEARPDVFTITKSVKAKWVAYHTDIDSIKVKLKPNGHFDFVVVLNGKDSCYTRLESPAIKNYSSQNPVTHDTIPFVLTPYNNIAIKAIVDNVDTLNLMFDSGTTGLLLTNDAIKNKTRFPDGISDNHKLRIGNLSWDSLRVYPVELSGQGLDGRFGWDLFDGKVVEIDFDKGYFIVHTKLQNISKAYSKLAMTYMHTLFCINGELQIKDKRYKNRFLFDDGYQRTAMLDTAIMNEQHYPKDLKVIKKVIMKNGVGREIPVITVNNERLNLDKVTMLNIPVQLMTAANPARFKTHILGNEVLKRFNTILDFQNNYVYLEPNHLFNLPYTDAN